jgi:hypothetical protein
MLMAIHALAAAAASLGAHGATCGWRPGEILELSGEVQTGGLTGKLLRRVETGSGRLFETDDLGLIITRNGFDGRLAWTQDMSGGVHDLNSAFARKLAVSLAWLDGRQGCAPSRRDGMTRLGVRADEGRRFTAWKASPRGGVPFELWYDQRTGRLDRAFFQMSESRLIRHFSDWRDLGHGRFVAFSERDEFPEDEDETVRRVAHAEVRKAARSADFARPRPPSDATILGGATATSVPYADDHRTRIYVPVYLNGKGPFLFELDTGGHNILTAETAQQIGVTGAGSFNSTGAGNAVSQSRIARVPEIRIGDAVITDQPVSIRKFNSASNDRSPNPPRAGILGLELFERFIVAIDRRAKTVTLKPFSSAGTPPGKKIALVFAEDAPLISSSFDRRRGDFMLDTGNAGPTIIEDYWARPLGLATRLEKGLRRGDTKVSRGSVGVGPFQLRDELVSYYGPAERGSEYSRSVAGVYGEPLLSRFNAVYDYSRNTVWLDPLPGLGPLPLDRSGLSLAKADGGLFKVSAVIPGSPADQAGIRAGDLLTAIDQVSAKTLSRADAAALLRDESGKTITLTGTFGGASGTRTIRLRDLLRP